MTLTKVSYSMINGAPVNVLDYGADSTGANDSTAAMQAAHATGKLVYYPAGTYNFTTITMVSGGICGDGPSQTKLVSTETGTADAITYTGYLTSFDDIPLFTNFELKGQAPTKISGCGIVFSPNTDETSYIHFENVAIRSFPTCVNFVRASLWKIIGCEFLSYTVAGVKIANANDPDSGDSVISSSIFNTPNTTGIGIIQYSSGGLKIVGNKFLGGLIGYSMQLTGSTSNLLISCNSFENMTGTDIDLSQATVGTAFIHVVITGNEFSVGPYAILTDASGFLSEVSIVGNVINMGSVGSNPCISFNDVTNFIIGENTFRGNDGLSSSAITLDSCTNGKIDLNVYSRLPNPLNIISSPTVYIGQSSQQGTSTTATTGWSAYGSLYQSPLTTITFTEPFLIGPSVGDIQANVGSGSGEVAVIISSSSTTGFSYRVVSVNTGIAATIDWKAWGVI